MLQKLFKKGISSEKKEGLPAKEQEKASAPDKKRNYC